MKEKTPSKLHSFDLCDIDTIIWDWNGTLLDDVDVNVKIINRLLSKRNLSELDLAAYKEIFCFPVKHFYHQIGVDLEKESIEEISVEYHTLYKSYEKDIRLNTDTVFILDAIREKGIDQYILSASGKDDLLRLVDHFGLTGKFEKIYGADNICATGKIGIGQILIQENQINPNRTLLIGDTLHDAEVAIALGVHNLLYSGGHNSYQILSKKARVLTCLNEIMSL